MSRYTGSIFRRSRRLNFSLLENNKEFAKGKKRTTIPGMHGNAKMRPKLSGYGEQLQEKQRMQYMYGIQEKQFRRLFSVAKKMEGMLTMRALSSSVDGSSKKATAAKEFESLSHTQEYNRHLARTIKENTQRLSVLKNNLNVLREIYEKRIVRISSDIYKMQRIVATLTASQRSYNLLEGSFDSMRRAQDDYQSVLNTYDPIGVDGLLDSTPGLVPFRRSPLESYRSALGRYDRGSKYGSLYDKYELSPDRTTSLDSYTSSFDTVGLDDEYKF